MQGLQGKSTRLPEMKPTRELETDPHHLRDKRGGRVFGLGVTRGRRYSTTLKSMAELSICCLVQWTVGSDQANGLSCLWKLTDNLLRRICCQRIFRFS